MRAAYTRGGLTVLKKTILILMALILIWTACAVAEEEETETAVTIPDPFRSWQGCVGDIAFSLPGMPEACILHGG